MHSNKITTKAERFNKFLVRNYVKFILWTSIKRIKALMELKSFSWKFYNKLATLIKMKSLKDWLLKHQGCEHFEWHLKKFSNHLIGYKLTVTDRQINIFRTIEPSISWNIIRVMRIIKWLTSHQLTQLSVFQGSERNEVNFAMSLICCC